MYLFDRVNELCGLSLLELNRKHFLRAFGLGDVPNEIYFELRREISWLQTRIGGLAAAKRFSLAPDTIRAAVSVLSSRPGSLLSCMEVLRIPWQEAWFEWDEDVRVAALREISPSSWQTYTNKRVVEPRKLSIYVKADPSGRRGIFRVAWPVAVVANGRPDNRDVVSASAGDVYFDFDAASGFSVCSVMPDGSMKLMQDLTSLVEQSAIAIGAEPTPSNVGAVGQMLAHFQAVYDRASINRCIEIGVAGLEVEGGDVTASMATDAGGEQVGKTATDVIPEILPFLSLMMLMTSVGGTQTRASDLVKLNKQRAKKKFAPLLEHEVVHVRLDRAQTAALKGIPSGQAGIARRPHIVGGHFVRRGDKIFWRRAHMRGAAAGGAVVGKSYIVGGAVAPDQVLRRQPQG